MAEEIKNRVIGEIKKRKITELYKLYMECVVTPTFLTWATYARAIGITSNGAAKEWG